MLFVERSFPVVIFLFWVHLLLTSSSFIIQENFEKQGNDRREKKMKVEKAETKWKCYESHHVLQTENRKFPTLLVKNKLIVSVTIKGKKGKQTNIQ